MKTTKLSEYARLETIYFCLQYGELLEDLEDIENTLRSPSSNNDRVMSSPNHSRVEDRAIKAQTRYNKIECIRQGVKRACKKCPELAPYILNAVTKEECTFDYLLMHGMPCCRNTFYRLKRKAYEEVNQLMTEKTNY